MQSNLHKDPRVCIFNFAFQQLYYMFIEIVHHNFHIVQFF